MPDERFFEPDVETMPRARIAALQEERILELVPYVYERSALVRRKWEEAKVKPSDVNSLADFTERVPFITKDDIRRFRDEVQDPFGGLLCTDYRTPPRSSPRPGPPGMPPCTRTPGTGGTRSGPRPPGTCGRSECDPEITCWAAASRCAGRSITPTR